MTSHSELLKRTQNLKLAVVECKQSGQINLDVVSEAHNGKTWRCLMGVYRDVTGENLHFGNAAEHFGIEKNEVNFLFGAANTSTISQREMFIDCHLESLEGIVGAKAVAA